MVMESMPAGDMRSGATHPVNMRSVDTRSGDTRLAGTREPPPNVAGQTPQQPSTPLGDGVGGSRRNIPNHHRGNVGNYGRGAGAQFPTQQRTCIVLDEDSDGEGDVQFLGEGENSCLLPPRQPCELGGGPAYVGYMNSLQLVAYLFYSSYFHHHFLTWKFWLINFLSFAYSIKYFGRRELSTCYTERKGNSSFLLSVSLSLKLTFSTTNTLSYLTEEEIELSRLQHALSSTTSPASGEECTVIE